MQKHDVRACWPPKFIPKPPKIKDTLNHQLEEEKQRWKKGEEIMLPRRMETEAALFPALPSQKRCP